MVLTIVSPMGETLGMNYIFIIVWDNWRKAGKWFSIKESGTKNPSTQGYLEKSLRKIILKITFALIIFYRNKFIFKKSKNNGQCQGQSDGQCF